MGFIENTVAFVFVLGVMVLIHELGHFLAARYFDVRVESFSFGFGPRLFGFKRGDTDYKVCALPLGGYVKMAGENIGEPSGDDPGEFLAKPRWQRLIIASMGPIFNGILAVALPIGLYMVHYERYAFFSEPPVVGYVEQGSSAEKAGVRRGDLILSIDSAPTPTWEALRLTEVGAVNKTVDIEYERAGERRSVSLRIEADARGIGYAGWMEDSRVRLGDALPGMPAAEAGISKDDILLSINAEPIHAVTQVIDTIERYGGTELDLEIERDGEIVETRVTPVFAEDAGEDGAWQIGVYLGPDHERVVTELGFGEAFRQSVSDNAANTTLIFKFLRGLVERRMSAKSLEGPIGIARLSGDAARSGWPQLILLMSAISLNLGIFNLLPIPILDGGLILMLLVESAIRRDFSIAVKERIVQAGLVFLVLLFAFVMYNDILKSLQSG